MVTIDERLLNSRQVAGILGVKRQTSAKWRMDGRGPCGSMLRELSGMSLQMFKPILTRSGVLP